MKNLKKRLRNQPITHAQMEKIAERAKLSAVEESVEIVVILSMLVLRNQGWGKKRLAQFKADFQEQLTALEEGYITVQDVIEMIYNETGLNVRS